MTGEVVRYNVLNGRFAIRTTRGHVVAELLNGQVAEGATLTWDEPVSTPACLYSGSGSVVEATILDVDVPWREVMELLGPW